MLYERKSKKTQSGHAVVVAIIGLISAVLVALIQKGIIFPVDAKDPIPIPKPPFPSPPLPLPDDKIDLSERSILVTNVCDISFEFTIALPSSRDGQHPTVRWQEILPHSQRVLDDGSRVIRTSARTVYIALRRSTVSLQPFRDVESKTIEVEGVPVVFYLFAFDGGSDDLLLDLCQKFKLLSN